MKRLLSFILSLVMLLSLVTVGVSGADAQTGTGSGAEFPFGDVPASRWSNPYVVLLYNEGVVNGRSANVFAPAHNIKRSEFVKMLAGAAGADIGSSEHSFTDVKSGSWYEPYVAWAAENGITNGVTPTEFAPDGLISRQDMATMIYRYVTKVLYPEESAEGGSSDAGSALPVTRPPVEFTDEDEIADYAKEAVKVMQGAGIIGGVMNADATFRFEPENKATREQVCKMLGELYMIINEGVTLPEPVAPPAYNINYNTIIGKPINGGRWVLTYSVYEDFALPTLAEQGYEFLGWSGPGINGRSVAPVIKAGSVAGDLVYTAHWKYGDIEIVFDLDGGTYPEIYN